MIYSCPLCEKEYTSLSSCGCPPLDTAIEILKDATLELYKIGNKPSLAQNVNDALLLIESIVYKSGRIAKINTRTYCDVYFGETREETFVFAIYGWFGEFETLQKCLDDLFVDRTTEEEKQMINQAWRCYIEKTYDNGWYMYHHTLIKD